MTPEHISTDGEKLRRGLFREEKLKTDPLLKTDVWSAEGVKTVILGKLNAGKSSLMNVLAGEDRATGCARTTRDILRTYLISGDQLKCCGYGWIRHGGCGSKRSVSPARWKR